MKEGGGSSGRHLIRPSVRTGAPSPQGEGFAGSSVAVAFLPQLPQVFLPQLPQPSLAAAHCLPMDGKADSGVQPCRVDYTIQENPKHNPEKSTAPLVFYRKQLYNQSISAEARSALP